MLKVTTELKFEPRFNSLHRLSFYPGSGLASLSPGVG